MPTWFSKKILYAIGGVVASAFGVVSTVDINLGSGAATPNQEAVTPAFQPSGRTSHDVMQALIALGRLSAASNDPRVAPVKRAIEESERKFGLPVDGEADQSLLNLLVDELHTEQGDHTPDASPTEQTNSLFAAIGNVIDVLLSEFFSRQGDDNHNDKTS